MDASQIAASTVLGAFALLTARNSLKNGAPEGKDDVATVGSLSSKSTSSEVDYDNIIAASKLNEKFDITVIKKITTSFDSVMDISDRMATFTFTSVPSSTSRKEGNIFLEPGNGNGEIILGAIQANSNVASVLSADDALLNLRTLNEVNRLKLSSVWHIGCSSVDAACLKLYTDYRILRTIDFTVFLPSTAQEVHDFAFLAHIINQQFEVPVANCFEGVSALTQKDNISTIALEKIPSFPVDATVSDVLSIASSTLLGKRFSPIQYHGAADAEIVFVALGSVAQVFIELTEKHHDIGVVVIKMLNPLQIESLLENIPKTSQRICVVDYGPSDDLFVFNEIAGAVWGSNLEAIVFRSRIDSIAISDVDTSVAGVLVSNASIASFSRDLVVNELVMEQFQSSLAIIGNTSSYGSVANSLNGSFAAHGQTEIQEVSLWLESSNTSIPLSSQISKNFKSFQVTQKEDTVRGITRVDFKLSQETVHEFTQFGISKADVGVSKVDSNFVEVAAKNLKPSGCLVLIGETGETFDVNKVSVTARKYIYNNGVNVFFATVDDLSNGELILKVALTEELLMPLNIFMFRTTTKQTPSPVEFISRKRLRPQSIRNPRSFQDSESSLSSAQQLAWNLLFKESYNVQEALRPSEHGVSTATVTKFERLTPDEYNRNIFHIEFDISGTGLKYEIGDALGVFGENDPVKVDEFITEYGLNPEEIVSLGSRGELEEGKAEYVSVRNLLLKKLDIFGKVQKRFYVELAAFAKSRYERLKLLHTGTDDAEQFKLGGYETVTPAELLLQYRSCKLTVQDMISIIPEIKARHYSISSSMKMSPSSVHLLVVAVDWKTPLGKSGEGQCTRYLKNLTIGQKVCVDIQKSVLRLPPDPKQPIVMAGLGTGMAPFRAFVQQRYFLKRSGVDIGPMVLYFGARHKAQEWLYGEELEKYERMGLLRLGLAWSRDQKKKVYIQHKIEDDSRLLKEYLKDQKGYFYLCGPTWPVPDVRDAINGGLEDDSAVDQLKEEGRYILEVY